MDSGDRTMAGDAPSEGDDTVASGAERAQNQKPWSLERGSSVGRYVVLERLGAGGMGVVYAAYDPELDRKLALKLLRADPKDDKRLARAKARFLREAQAMARLAHPNVITVHDVGTFEDRVFFAMEFVEGSTLSKWLGAAPRTWREVLDVMIASGRGLAAAHAAGLVHRDFKPDNVLISHTGKVRVLDFGLARALDDADTTDAAADLPHEVSSEASNSPLLRDLTKTGSLMGTPRYMAPEQHLARPSDARTDQFAFCIAAYESLYRKRPFAGETPAELAVQVTQGKINEPPRETKVPTWVKKAVLRGLNVDRADRWPSMEALLAQLSRDPTAATRRRLALATLVVVPVGVGFGAVEYLQRQREQVCAGAADELDGVWDETRKQTARAAFEATALPFASDAWTLAESWLDAYSASWTEMRTDACEATRIRGEQSEQLLGLRIDCLHQRRDEVRALVDLFAKADPEIAESSISAASKLTPIDRCADTRRLTSQVELPTDASAATRVAELRAELTTAKALGDAGHLEDGIAVGVRVVEAARTLGYRPLLAEALMRLGRLQSASGDHAAAEQSLSDAAWLADGSRHDTVAASAKIALVEVVGSHLRRYEPGHLWGRHAQAAVERLGPGGPVEAELLDALGSVFRGQGQYQSAHESHRGALEILAKHFGEDHPKIVLVTSNLGRAYAEQGHFSDAREQLERAVELAEGTFGAHHPAVARAAFELGDLLTRSGNATAATAQFQRAVELHRSSYGTDHPEVADALASLARARLADGRLAEALTPANEALAIRTRRLSSTDPVLASTLALVGRIYRGVGDSTRAAEALEHALSIFDGQRIKSPESAAARFELAQAVWDNDASPDRARPLAEAAREQLAKDKERFAAEIAEIDRWRAEIDGKPRR